MEVAGKGWEVSGRESGNPCRGEKTLKTEGGTGFQTSIV